MPYKIALFIHVVSVLALFAAIGLELTELAALRRALTVEHVRAWARETAFVGRVFPLSAVVILATGIYMVAASWGANAAWAAVSLLALVILGALGGAINGKRMEAIHEAAEAAPAGAVPAALRRQIADPVLRTSVQTMTAVALGIVYLMTIKPGWLGSVLTLLVAAGLGVASALPARRAGAASATEERPAAATGAKAG